MNRLRRRRTTPDAPSCHQHQTSSPPIVVRRPLVASAAIVAFQALLFVTPASVASAAAALPRVGCGRAAAAAAAAGGGVPAVVVPPPAFVIPHPARVGRGGGGRRGGPRGVAPVATATAPVAVAVAGAGVVGADTATDTATARRGRGRRDEDDVQVDDEGGEETTNGTEAATSMRVRVRRADPDEVYALSSLVADCFARTAAEGTGDGDLNGKSYRRANDELASIVAARVERFVLRWMVFAGMIERLVRSSFAAGYAEGIGGADGADSADGVVDVMGGLFVAELVAGEGTSAATDAAAMTSPSSPVVVGVAELAPPGPCPVPLGYSTREREEDGGRSRSRRPRAAPFVCNLAVCDGYRNLGVGRSLLRRCEAECGASEVWLETLGTNVAALRLYRSEGYVCEGVDPEGDGGGGRRSFRRVYMRKRLTDDSPEYYGAGAGRDDDVLRIVPAADGGGWTAEFDLGDDGGDGGGPSCVIQPTFAERCLGGAVGPAVVAAAGVLIGLPVRLSRITR